MKIKTLGERLLMITTGDMEVLLKDLVSFTKQTPIPEIEARINSSPLFVYFPRFTQSPFSGRVPINQKRLPIGEVWLAMEIHQGLYDIISRFRLESAEDASLFSRSFRTFLLWLRKEAIITDFVQRAEVEVVNNTVRTGLSGFTEDEIGRGMDVFGADEAELGVF